MAFLVLEINENRTAYFLLPGKKSDVESGLWDQTRKNVLSDPTYIKSFLRVFSGVILKYTTTHNHLQLPTTIHNHPQPSKFIHSHKKDKKRINFNFHSKGLVICSSEYGNHCLFLNGL